MRKSTSPRIESYREENKLSKKVLSIEVGLFTTRICELEAGKRNPHVSNCISFDTPENIVEDGFILDKETLAAEMKKHLAKDKITTKDVIFTVSSTKIANREVVIPLVPESKIRSVVDANATEYFPLDISEYTISYSILDKINTKDEKKLKLLLLAAPNNLIKNIYSFAQMMGFHVSNIDYMGNSSYQVVKKQVGAGVNVSIQINEQTTLVNVIENEKLVLQRTVPYGAMNIINAVLDNPTFNKKTPREAAMLLMQENLINAYLDMGDDVNNNISRMSENYDKIMQEVRGREDITSAIAYIMNNVIRVMDYFMSRNSDKKVNGIFLIGIGSKFKGIEILFKNEMGYEIRKIESLFGITFSKSLNVPVYNQAEFLCCIGATIAPVGFVPSDAEKKSEHKNDVKIMFGVMVGATVVAFLMTAVPFVNMQVAKGTQKKLKTKVEQLSPIRDIYAQRDAAYNEYQHVLYMYDQTSNRNYQLNMMIEELEARLPASMTVSSLTSDGSYLNMNITTDTKISIAEMLMQLKQISSLTDVNVASLVEDEDEENKRTVVTFAVTAVYKPFESFEDENEPDLQMKDEAEAGADSTTDTTEADTVGEGTENE